MQKLTGRKKEDAGEGPAVRGPEALSSSLSLRAEGRPERGVGAVC